MQACKQVDTPGVIETVMCEPMIGPVMDDRIIVSHRPDVDRVLLMKQLEAAGATRVEQMAVLPETILAIVDADAVDDFIRQAAALPGVRHAERDRMRYSI